MNNIYCYMYLSIFVGKYIQVKINTKICKIVPIYTMGRTPQFLRDIVFFLIEIISL